MRTKAARIAVIGLGILLSLACGFGTEETPQATATPTTRAEGTQTMPGDLAPTGTRAGAPTPTDQNTPTATTGALPTFPWLTEVEDYDPGETVQVDPLALTLNSAVITGDLLQANFTIQNLGTENFSFNPYGSFTAEQNNYLILIQDESNCPAESLRGVIPPGGSLTGNICWSGVSTDELRILYAPIVTGQGFIGVGLPIAAWEVER
jgi:hypothetical protein